jgi:long-chain acyl-CoA synthetase
MSDLGFWNQAKANPNRIARRHRRYSDPAGELLARSNRLVHGLRALGMQRGDCITTVLPNGAAMIELYLAAAQGGWYLTPINHHLTGPEIAYIVKDSDAKVFVGHERFAATCRAAADEIGFPATHRFAVGKVEGFRAYEDLSVGQPDTTPENRTAGQVMNYTSGTTGRPKGGGATYPTSSPTWSFRCSRCSWRCSEFNRRTTTSTSSARRCTIPQCCCSPLRRCIWDTPWC